MPKLNPTTFFFCGVILAASGLVSPPFALLGGLLFGLTQKHPFSRESHTLTSFLLQVSVVLLGFGMKLSEVLHAGRAGFVYTAFGITFAIALGLALGRFMKIAPKASLLITCGTAICGGSAIAALAPVIEADANEMAVSLGTVFSLNAVALLLFPAVGLVLHMTQAQFGLWSALAIHDTSSVVGATAKYGPQALEIGTTIKLARALWIVPLTLIVASLYRKRRSAGAERTGADEPAKKINYPWFIAFFVLAAILRSYFPLHELLWGKLNSLGKAGLTTVLFLIGTGLSRDTLRNVGWRPMLQGVVLWVVVATVSLLAIREGLISI